MANYTVTCHRCGASFQTTKYKASRNKRHYCSQKCFINSTVVQCDHCGKDVTKQGYQVSRYKKMFCNSDCHKSYMAKNKLTIQRKCEQCNKKFTIHTTPSANMPFKYCSKECHNRAMDTRYEKECPVCHKVFLAKPCNAKRGGDTYCSRHCKIKGKEPTLIEVIIGKVLSSLSVEYIPQYPIGRYVCDYFIPSSQLVIECDGSYWHSIPNVKERDRKKDKHFANRGYNVLRLPEDLIKNNLAACRSQIISHLKQVPASNGTQYAQEVLQNDSLHYVQAALEFAQEDY
jgi:very-short-patch-repair endonuclease/endogenous inhibitor of DNA gyrase (YacG/DUF329 family)